MVKEEVHLWQLTYLNSHIHIQVSRHPSRRIRVHRILLPLLRLNSMPIVNVWLGSNKYIRNLTTWTASCPMHRHSHLLVSSINNKNRLRQQTLIVVTIFSRLKSPVNINSNPRSHHLSSQLKVHKALRNLRKESYPRVTTVCCKSWPPMSGSFNG